MSSPTGAEVTNQARTIIAAAVADLEALLDAFAAGQPADVTHAHLPSAIGYLRFGPLGPGLPVSEPVPAQESIPMPPESE